jgi:mannose-6-phosphate isomerase-like protein (cupin superfamily)
MMQFVTRSLPERHDVIAPDGSEVRILAASNRGSMAHFRLPPGAVSKAVAHRTVEEIWYVVSGQGRMWRKNGSLEETTELLPGVSLTIATGTHFQFRNDGSLPLEAVGVAMPPWPGMDEAYEVEGGW